MTEHHAIELRRALAEAADANRAVLALVAGARATLERADVNEDLPIAGDVDTAARLLSIAEGMGRGAAAVLLLASLQAEAALTFGIEKEGLAHD